MSIRRKMTAGVLWSLLEKGGIQAASLIVFLVVARIVGPTEYGLASLCMVYIGLATIIFFFILDSVVKDKIEDDKSLSTAFWLATLCGLITSLAGVGLAFIMPVVFDEPRLKLMMLALSIIPVFLGTAALPSALYAQRMNFKVPALRGIIANVLSGVVGIYLAVKGFGAYAIIIQQIIQYIIINIVVWLYLGWTPKFQFASTEVKSILMPGFATGGSGLISFAQEYLPRVFIGFFLNAEAVGFYAFATRIAMALRELLFAPLSNVIFPTLSNIKDDVIEQKKILSELIQITGIIVFPIVFGAIVVTDQFIQVAFGQSWEGAVFVLQIALISTLSMPFIRIIISVFRAYSAMGAFITAQSVLTSITLIACLLAASHSVVAVTAVYSISTVLSLIIFTMVLNKKLFFDFWRDYKKLLLPFLSSLAMVSIIIAGQHYLESFLTKGVWQLVCLIIIGAAAYFIIIGLLFRKKIVFLLNVIKTRKSSVNG